ncbi:MAG: hypothetical protein ACKVOJ_13160 [Sphingomonadaceae bacterium]
MKHMMRVILVAVGLLNIAIGLGFLINPHLLAEKFFVAPVGTQGLATIRADFPAFFLTGGAFALVGAWRAVAPPLLVPLALLGFALIGRFVSLALDGAAPTAFAPMIAEMLMIVALCLGYRSFAAADD